MALGLAFLAGFLAVGLDYWRIPYAALSLPSAIPDSGLAVVAIAAALSRAVGDASVADHGHRRRFGPGRDRGAIIHDVARDATTHNLWPLEIVLAAGPGCLAALAGAIVVGVLAPRRRD